MQFDSKLGLVEKNAGVLTRLVEEAAKSEARLIVAPEMVLSGYLFADRDEALPFSESVPGPSTDRLSELCRKHHLYVVFGLLERDQRSEFLYNSAALVGPDGYIGKYRKTHLFFTDTRWAVGGDARFSCFDLPFGRVGIMVCMDVSFFETARIATLSGAQILAFPLNSRMPAPSDEWRVRAAENGVYLLASNRTGFERGTRFTGGSAIIAPDGSIVKSLGNEPGAVVAEIDTSLCGRDVWGFGRPLADRRPDTYYPLLLNPYDWPATESHGLVSEGVPWIVANPARGDFDTVRQKCETVWRDFRSVQGVRPDLMVLPEKAVSKRQRDEFMPISSSESVAFGKEVAEALGIVLVFGFEELDGNHLWNSMVLVTPRGLSAIYRQIHLSPEDRASAKFKAGTNFKTVDLSWGRVGLAIGSDLFYPETIRCLSQNGADIILAGMAKDPSPLWMMIRERSRNNNVHVVVASTGSCGIFLSEDQRSEGRASGSNEEISSSGHVGRAAKISGQSLVREKPSLRRRRPELYHVLVKLSGFNQREYSCESENREIQRPY